jgi:hypothetical protein
MNLTVNLYKPDFTDKLQPPNVKFAAQSISWRNIGGPDVATVQGTGDWDLDEAINFLRCPIEIFGPNGDCIWWGYVDSIRAIDKEIEYGVGMDTVSNDVMVLYPKSVAHNVQIQTYWSSTIYGTNDSITRLGTKQKQSTTNSPGQAAGDALRDTLFAFYQWPKPTIKHSPNNSGNYFELSCKGWYDTLDWIYYGGVQKSYDDLNGASWHSTWYSQYLGDTVRAIGQKITMPYTGTIDAIGANWATGGAPDKPAKMYIFADGSTPGTWGTQLATAEASKSRIDAFEGFEWEVYKLDSAVSKNAGDNFWIVFDSQNIGKSDIYKTWIKQEAGSGIIHNGTSWISPVTPFNMIYRTYLTTDSGDQIRDIMSRCGQFIAGYDTFHTGVNAASQMGSITTGKSVMDNLVNMGTSNNKMLVAKALRSRYVRIYESELANVGISTLILKSNGHLYNRSGGELYPPYTDPCGQWVTIESLVPSTLSAARAIDASIFRVARATYNAQTEQSTLEPDGVSSPFEIFAVSRK